MNLSKVVGSHQNRFALQLGTMRSTKHSEITNDLGKTCPIYEQRDCMSPDMSLKRSIGSDQPRLVRNAPIATTSKLTVWRKIAWRQDPTKSSHRNRLQQQGASPTDRRTSIRQFNSSLKDRALADAILAIAFVLKRLRLARSHIAMLAA